MAIEIKSLKESVTDNGLKVLVHGPAGVGKTVMCATTREKTLIINTEGGLLSIRNAPGDIDVVRIQDYAALEELYEALEDEDNPHPYFWICLDSISEIAEVCLAAEKAEAKDPRKAYGEMADKMFDMLRNFRDLPHVHVCMTCKQQRYTDEVSGVATYFPSFPGRQLSGNISYMFDEVFALLVLKDDEGDKVRYVQTDRDANYEAKDRSGELDELEDPDLYDIAKKIMGDDYGKKTSTKVETKKKVNKSTKAKPPKESKGKRKLNLGKRKSKPRSGTQTT